ncbi:MAG TPA: hypothetical protein VH062_02890 [Polyangiaceae bacterium]|nr:hypothetical protein [Polyangiaceae bacterium]
MSSRRPRGTPWNLIVVGVVGVVVVVGLLALRARGQEPSADPSTAAASASSAADLEALLDSPANSAGLGGDSDPAKSKILGKTSLPDAIAVARPLMSNTIGRLDVGSAQLAMWASRYMSWQALEALPETTPALFKKDPDAERGRRFCMSGTVLEIRAEKTLSNRIAEDKALPLIERSGAGTGSGSSNDSTFARPEPFGSAMAASSGSAPDPVLLEGMDFAIPDNGKVYFATIQSKPEPPPEGTGKTKSVPRDSTFVEIIAVKSSGNLVDGSEARVCGVMTGVTVPPAGISTSAAIDAATVHRIVGMFDLPQNRAASGVDVTAQHE